MSEETTNELITPDTETTSNPEAITTPPTRFLVHAVVAHKTDGEVKVLHGKTKTALIKTLEEHGPEWAVLGVFRGKQLKIAEKVSFSFN